jgi:hypothetical protein
MTGLSKQSGHFSTFRVTRTGMLCFFFAPLIQSFRQSLLPQILVNKNCLRHSLFSPRELSSAAQSFFFPPKLHHIHTDHSKVFIDCCCRRWVFVRRPSCLVSKNNTNKSPCIPTKNSHHDLLRSLVFCGFSIYILVPTVCCGGRWVLARRPSCRAEQQQQEQSHTNKK